MSDCYCDLGDAPEFYCLATPKARKVHECYECGMAIQPGERYENLRAKWDGSVSTIKTCPDCASIRDALKEMPCFCWLHGSLLDDVTNQFEEAHFTPGLRFNLLRIVADHRAVRQKRERYVPSNRISIHRSTGAQGKTSGTQEAERPGREG